jgi:hypothetical protein
MTLVERARLLIARCEPAVAGSGGHSATFKVAAALVWGFGFTPEEAFPLMAEYNATCMPMWSEHDLWHKLRSALAAGSKSGKPRGHLVEGDADKGAVPEYVAPRKKEAIVYDEEALRGVQRAGLTVDDAWLMARSPYDPRKLQPGHLLDLLYDADDKVMVFCTMQSRGDYMRWRGAWYMLGKTPQEKAVKAEQVPPGSREGMIHLVQPVDGKWHPKLGGVELSRRTKASVMSYPYLLLESDEAPPQLWLNALVQLALPIVSITRSAGRSIHALVRVGVQTRDEWDDCVSAVRDSMARIGCDSQALKNPMVNCRLGNTWREGKMMGGGKERKFQAFSYGRSNQRLLYCNPTAGMLPILTLPTRAHGGAAE